MVRRSKDCSNLGSATHCSRERECTLPGPQPADCRKPRAPCLMWCANNNHITNQAPLKTLQRICERHKIKIVQHSARTLIEPQWAAACFHVNYKNTTSRMHVRQPLPRELRTTSKAAALSQPFQGPDQPANQQRPTGNKINRLSTTHPPGHQRCSCLFPNQQLASLPPAARLTSLSCSEICDLPLMRSSVLSV